MYNWQYIIIRRTQAVAVYGPKLQRPVFRAFFVEYTSPNACRTTLNKYKPYYKESLLMAERIQGVVKWFNGTKGYGFLQQPDGPDVFVHYSAIEGSGFRNLEEGERVEFSVVEGPKGLQASNVIKIN
jgi:CspA family cold shock protein